MKSGSGFKLMKDPSGGYKPHKGASKKQHLTYKQFIKEVMATYKGKKVTLNKPRRIAKGETSYGKKKSVVYVTDGDKVKRVTFGDPNMRIKKSSPERRKSFRARHNCDNAKDKTSAKYWSCKAW